MKQSQLTNRICVLILTVLIGFVSAVTCSCLRSPEAVFRRTDQAVRMMEEGQVESRDVTPLLFMLQGHALPLEAAPETLRTAGLAESVRMPAQQMSGRFGWIPAILVTSAVMIAALVQELYYRRRLLRVPVSSSETILDYILRQDGAKGI